jgi:multiple sugar transport system ATP-binding protein
MGRAIIRQPSVFLMDEPLSNLDAKLRVLMRAEIAQLQDRLGVTTIYVTHDQVEAMTMGDRVALMRDGVLQQVDTPSGIYNRPANTFVAAFIGSPSMNLFKSTVVANGDGEGTLILGSQRLRIPSSVFARRPALISRRESEVIVGIRPEDMEDGALRPGHADDMRLQGDVFLAESLGSDQMAHFSIDAPMARVSDELIDELAVPKTAAGVCIARFGARSEVKAGQRVAIAVDCERLQFFDAVSGRAI